MINKQIVKVGNKFFSSEIAHSLMIETGATNPIRAIEIKVNNLLGEACIEKPPVDLNMLASFVGVTAIQETEIIESGRLVPKRKGEFIIQVRRRECKGRRNFTIAHEIGHALMPGSCLLTQPKIDIQTGWYQERDEEEYLCDVAARSLLLPESLFGDSCIQKAPTIINLCGLAEDYGASLEAVAFRLAELKLWPCIPVFWEYSLRKKQIKTLTPCLPGFEELGTPQREFRVKYSAGEGNHFFPAEKHIPHDSPMVVGCQGSGFYAGECSMPASKGDITVYVEALFVTYSRPDGEKQDRILSLIFPNVSNPHQPAFSGALGII